MKKYITILLFSFIALIGCKELIEAENGIRATGDYSGLLTKRITQNPPSGVVSWEVSSITDSTNITYPTFMLSLSDKKGALVVREADGKPLKYYYAAKHRININSSNSLEINNITFLSGKGISANDEIIDPDDTKTVILNGKLKL